MQSCGISLYLSLDGSVSKSYRLGVMPRERIVAYEDGADLLRDSVVREACVALEAGDRLEAWRRVEEAVDEAKAEFLVAGRVD